MRNCYLVPVEALEAGVLEISIVPASFFAFNEWPQEPPGDDGADKHRDVYQVRADHSDTNISSTQVEVETARTIQKTWPRRHNINNFKFKHLNNLF
jgi:hypothetical protein